MEIHWDNGLVSHLHTYTCDEEAAQRALDEALLKMAPLASEIRLVRKVQDGPKGNTFKSIRDAYQARCKADERCSKYGLQTN